MVARRKKPADDEPNLRDSLRQTCNERGIQLADLLEAIEEAMVGAYKRAFGHEAHCVVETNKATGQSTVYRRRVVAERAFNPITEISQRDAGRPYEPGDFYDEPVNPADFGRMGALTAKSIILNCIRDCERNAIYNEYIKHQYALIGGTVLRFNERSMFVDLGKAEAILPPAEQVTTERYKINDRILAFVSLVRKSTKGPQVVLSRNTPALVQRLLEFETPEIADGTVEIMAIAREAGLRSKIAVHSHNPNVDAVGTCVGPKASRIAAVSDELRGEKIDIIRWSADPAEFLESALAPAKIIGVELFADDATAIVTVPDYQMSLAIGIQGINVRLASRLTGWRIDLTDEDGFAECRERYLAGRVERESELEGIVAVPESENAPERQEIDPGMLETLQAFKRERFG